ncbi:hypothetical protein [Deinococcus petrolearius]|uniref:AMIN domain-containing protein n=1 Tax=Deinococcus petrolearius TaxID=1751295 RepID=A0ABW1DMM5_9DEIO
MKTMPFGRHIALALALSSLALSVPAAAQTQQFVEEVPLEQLTRVPKVITVSPSYQVVLRFPMPISGLSVQTEKQKNYKITPMQNRQVFFIDAKVKSGEADMYAVLPDTSVLLFRLVIKNQAAGQRIIRVLGEGEVAQSGTAPATTGGRTATAPAPAPSTAPARTTAATARPTPPATRAAVTRTTAAPAATPRVPSLPVSTGAPSRPAITTTPRPAAAAPRTSQENGSRTGGLTAAQSGAPLEYRLTTRREGTALVIDYTLKSKADRALVVRHQDLRVLTLSGGVLNVTHLKTPQFGALLPGRTIQGSVRVETPANNVVLEWPMSNLATRDHYNFRHLLAASR